VPYSTTMDEASSLASPVFVYVRSGQIADTYLLLPRPVQYLHLTFPIMPLEYGAWSECSPSDGSLRVLESIFAGP
jgi:hypothetical protein